MTIDYVTDDQIDDVADRILDTARIESKRDAVRQIMEAALDAGWSPPS